MAIAFMFASILTCSAKASAQDTYRISIGVGGSTSLSGCLHLSVEHPIAQKWSVTASIGLRPGQSRWKKNKETIEHYKEFGLYPSDNVLSVPAHLENFRFSFWPEDAGKGIAISAGAEHSSTEGFDFICGISYRIPIWKGLSAGIGAQIRCIRQVMDDSGRASADLNLNYRF